MVLSINCRVGAVGLRKPLNIKITQDSISLKTSVYNYEYLDKSSGKQLVTLSLYSILHVADSKYYRELERQLVDTDIVLYELITARANTKTAAIDLGLQSSSASQLPVLLKRLITPITSPAAEALASRFNLDTQLSLPLMDDASKSNHRNNWFIADLDSETLRALEAPRRGLMDRDYINSQIAGARGRGSPVLPKFFL